jgi:hypothetical protein
MLAKNLQVFCVTRQVLWFEGAHLGAQRERSAYEVVLWMWSAAVCVLIEPRVAQI